MQLYGKESPLFAIAKQITTHFCNKCCNGIERIIDDKNVLITNFFSQKETENEIYKNPLYPKRPNPTTISEDYALSVDKDTIRHDTLLMKIVTNKNAK